STVARMVAEKLGMQYLDTGAMYRALTYKVLSSGIMINDEKSVTQLARNTELEVENRERLYVWCDGEEIGLKIRSTEVTRAVSVIAAYFGVREYMVGLQKKIALQKNVVMDGRDIGTNVLPNANLKIFLTASLEERAKRRYFEIKKAGKECVLEELISDIKLRDKNDSQRNYAPLKPAVDAIILDTTELSLENVVDRIVAMSRRQREGDNIQNK
ncbi:MAG: (d)CMP kinase, partial [Eubacteriales bacterium]